MTIAEKGYVKAFDDPEIQAPAAQYGDPELILGYAWIPSIAGINVPGDYQADFAADPWAWILQEWGKIEEGTYGHYVEDYSLEPLAADPGAALEDPPL